MENRYLEFIRTFLGNSPVMKPEPTSVVPSIGPDETIKAVIFDVYGTIIISASGDIEESEISARNLEQSLNETGIQIIASQREKQKILIEMLQVFRHNIRKEHEMARSHENPYPEIDILSVWENILIDLDHTERIAITDPLCIKCFTFVFETLSNRIYPMPGMKKVIHTLSEKGIPLGIISNAQFYTPVILNYFLNDMITEDEEVTPFDPDLTVYSYKHKRAKPDPYLFEIMTNRFREKYEIVPGEILFLGNDMFRDIYPAHRAGYKTVLFAGDDRSLRLREEKEELIDISPDYTITELEQLLKIFS